MQTPYSGTRNRPSWQRNAQHRRVGNARIETPRQKRQWWGSRQPATNVGPAAETGQWQHQPQFTSSATFRLAGNVCFHCGRTHELGRQNCPALNMRCYRC